MTFLHIFVYLKHFYESLSICTRLKSIISMFKYLFKIIFKSLLTLLKNSVKSYRFKNH